MIKRKFRMPEKKVTNKIIDLSMEQSLQNIYIPVASTGASKIELQVADGEEVKVGSLIAIQTEPYYHYIYSSVSGRVSGFETRYSPLNGRSVKHVHLVNDFKYTTIKKEPFDYLTASEEEILARIKEAGIVGLGGAGFPTYKKYENTEKIDTILVNGMECEWYTFIDSLLTVDYLEQLLTGTAILVKLSGANKGIIALPNNNLLVKFLNSNRELVKQYSKLEVRIIKEYYPYGYEKILIEKILDRQYEYLPYEAGVIVNNIKTVLSINRAITEGLMPTNSYVAINGDGIKSSGNFLVPNGTLYSAIIDELYGYKAEEVVISVGGVLTGNPALNDTFTINHPISNISVMKKLKHVVEACIRCGSCSNVCPVGLQPIEIKNAVESKDNVRLKKLDPRKCCECGLCSYVCPSKIEVTKGVKRGKIQLNLLARDVKK